MMSEIRIRHCPKCGVRTDKIGGCNLLHCIGCNSGYCYICNQLIEKRDRGNYYHHFLGSGSTDQYAKCPLYGDDAIWQTLENTKYMEIMKKYPNNTNDVKKIYKIVKKFGEKECVMI